MKRQSLEYTLLLPVLGCLCSVPAFSQEGAAGEASACLGMFWDAGRGCPSPASLHSLAKVCFPPFDFFFFLLALKLRWEHSCPPPLLQFWQGFNRQKSVKTLYFDILSISKICKLFLATARPTLVKGALKGSGEIHFLPDHKKKKSLVYLALAQLCFPPFSVFWNVLVATCHS